MSFSKTENGISVCVPYEGDLSYEAYLTYLLTEVGYVLVYLSPFEKMLEFIHEKDSKMKIIVSLNEDGCWYHFIIYGTLQWCVKYYGETKFHKTGNRVFHAIRESYRLGQT